MEHYKVMKFIVHLDVSKEKKHEKYGETMTERKVVKALEQE